MSESKKKRTVEMTSTRTVPSHPNYGVTIDGRILNLKRGTWLSTFKKPRGGHGVLLYSKGVQTYFQVKRLVASLYMADFDPCRAVIHLDGDVDNIHVSNLAMGDYVTNWREVL